MSNIDFILLNELGLLCHKETELIKTVNKLLVNDKEYEIKFKKEDMGEVVLVELESCIDIVTPGFGKIIGDPACSKTSKTIRKE